MNQTSIIAASLILAYIVFVTVRGELPAYLGVFTGKPKGTVSGGTETATTPGIAGSGGLSNDLLSPGAGNVNSGFKFFDPNNPGSGNIFDPWISDTNITDPYNR